MVKRISVFKGAIAALSASTLLCGCTANETDDMSARTILSILNSQPGLTTLDDNFALLKYNDYTTGMNAEVIDNSYYFKISDLDDELSKTPELCDIIKCNQMLETAINEVLKTEFSEYSGINYSELHNFSVTGNRYIENFDYETNSLYGISFNYNYEKYDLLANNDMAKELCYYSRACFHRELDYNELHQGYKVLKNSFLASIKFNERTCSFEGKCYPQGIDEFKIEYTGTFNMYTDYDKNSYVKQYKVN